jgi:hypothetical protein
MRVHLWRTTFIIFFLFVSQILFVWLIISVSYCHLDLVVAFFYRFCLSIWLFIFYLGHFVILVFFIALVTTLFVVSCSLIKDILLMLSCIIIIIT